jgi:hypothetical protein
MPPARPWRLENVPRARVRGRTIRCARGKMKRPKTGCWPFRLALFPFRRSGGVGPTRAPELPNPPTNPRGPLTNRRFDGSTRGRTGVGLISADWLNGSVEKTGDRTPIQATWVHLGSTWVHGWVHFPWAELSCLGIQEIGRKNWIRSTWVHMGPRWVHLGPRPLLCSLFSFPCCCGKKRFAGDSGGKRSGGMCLNALRWRSLWTVYMYTDYRRFFVVLMKRSCGLQYPLLHFDPRH